MHQFPFSERRVWATRAPMSVALACIGLLLLAAARNDHWSATIGVAIARCAIGGAAGIAARPILTAVLTSMGLRRATLALPRLLMASFTIGVSSWAAGDVSDRALVAINLTLPGLLLDALLCWREAAAPSLSPSQQEHPDDHHRP